MMTLDAFIQDRLEQPVDLFLVNGIKLRGMIVLGCDPDAIFLRSPSEPMTHVVLWSAVSTIVSREHGSTP
jgi:sRNA-binding regulator protein Hfq